MMVTHLENLAKRLAGVIRAIHCDVGISNGNDANTRLSDTELQQMRDEISRIYSQIGIDMQFVSQAADFFISIRHPVAPYTTKANSVGSTPLSPDGLSVTSGGYVFPERLVDSARRNFASSVLWDAIVRSGSYSPLAVGVGRASAHEIGHNLLQQLIDGPGFFGVMRDAFSGGAWFANSQERLDQWTFSADQAQAIKRAIQARRGCEYERIHGGLRGREPDF